MMDRELPDLRSADERARDAIKAALKKLGQIADSARVRLTLLTDPAVHQSGLDEPQEAKPKT